MSETVSILTCTGFRPEALALCEKFMLRQTYKGPIEWVIVDDSIHPPAPSVTNPLETKITSTLPFEAKEIKKQITVEPQHVSTTKVQNITKKLYAGPVPWYQGINTQRPNMHEGLKHLTGDYVFVWEDDDWYHPEYIEQQIWLMTKYKVVGECNNRYYNIKERMYKYWGNIHHSSLCSTGMRKECLKVLYEATNSGELFMDMSFWRKCREQGVKSVLFEGTNLGVGIKGLPGRMGIGSGHHSLPDQGFAPDPSFEMLKRWIGLEDTQLYVKTLQGAAK